MKVLVLGASGMLGHKLCRVLSQSFQTWGTVRGEAAAYERFGLLDDEHLIGNTDATHIGDLENVIATVQPEVVVNAVGVIKQLPEASDAVTSITLNSLLPHQLEQVCNGSGCRLIHISTDCVFSGRKGMYSEEDVADAGDMYGRTKLLGEVCGPNSLTVRTSIIGRELSSNHGLVEWLLSNRGGIVDGYRRSIFSGLPTLALGEVIGDIIENHQDLAGLFHVSAEPIPKLDLLRLIRDAYGVEVEIRPVEGEDVDRSLDSTKFRVATGFSPPGWVQLIEQMAGDPTPYEAWRRRI